MAQVTQIKPQTNNPHRFNIFLDGKFAFGADEDLVIAYRLVVGRNLSPEEVKEIVLEKVELGKLLEKVFRLLSFRQRSEKEIRDYFKIENLRSKAKGKTEISKQLVDKLIDKLKLKGLVNDLEFATLWVKSRRQSKKKSLRALKSELFQKGVDREIISQVLSSEDTVSEESLAKEALDKKLKAFKNFTGLEFRQKAIQFLLRRGFAYSIAKKVAFEAEKS